MLWCQYNITHHADKHRGEVKTLSIAADYQQKSTVCFCFTDWQSPLHRSRVSSWPAEGSIPFRRNVTSSGMLSDVSSHFKPIMYCHGRALISAVESGIGRETQDFGTGFSNKPFTLTWLKTWYRLPQLWQKKNGYLSSLPICVLCLQCFPERLLGMNSHAETMRCWALFDPSAKVDSEGDCKWKWMLILFSLKGITCG